MLQVGALRDGRAAEYLEVYDMEGILRGISCPVLLLRANPELGALMSTEAAEHAVSLLPDAVQVKLAMVGHDLGMSDWDVGPLLRTITDFLLGSALGI